MQTAQDRARREALTRWTTPALLAGASGAFVKVLFLMAASLVMGAGFFTPLHLAGATFGAFQPPALGFAPLSALVGLGLHLLTGAVWGLLFGLVALAVWPRSLATTGRAIAMGLGLGLVYQLAAWSVGAAINPYSAAITPLLGAVPVVLANALFGVVTALALRGWAGRSRVTISMWEETAVADRTRLPR